MEIDITQVDGVIIARLQGLLDEDAHGPFEEQLHPLVVERGNRVVLDLSGVPRTTSMGLGQLVTLVVRANTKGARVVLAASSPFVRSVLAVSKLDLFFAVEDSVAQAQHRLA